MLSAAGLKYGLLVGLATGVLAFIPFVGWALGLITATVLAAVQFWPDLVPMVIVVGIFLAGQALDAAVLSPRIVGSKIGLHPVWLIFSLFVFSYLFGFVGALVAVPVAAAMGVLVRFALDLYLASAVYQGREVSLRCGAPRGRRRMSAAPRQLVLDLAHRSALGAEDFLVSRSNARPSISSTAGGLAPLGGARRRSGRLGQDAPRERLAAEIRRGGDRGRAPLGGCRGRAQRPQRALAVEDLDRGIAEERVLFHLLNLAREHKLSILLTSRLAAGELDVGLPDLRSRLRALPLVRIESPDEALLQGVLVKLFADRQLDVEPHVVSFLARRMERSMAAATRTVAEVDRLALALQRKVTRAVAAAALGASEAGDEDH